MRTAKRSNDSSNEGASVSFQAPITIAQALDGVHQRRYLLPAIQREFVWSTTQIEQLFDSLMRGYPIGSFLFWQVAPEHVGEYQYYEFIRDYHERDHRHAAAGNIEDLDHVLGEAIKHLAHLEAARQGVGELRQHPRQQVGVDGPVARHSRTSYPGRLVLRA